MRLLIFALAVTLLVTAAALACGGKVGTFQEGYRGF
jgi:hypothetical protein